MLRNRRFDILLPLCHVVVNAKPLITTREATVLTFSRRSWPYLYNQPANRSADSSTARSSFVISMCPGLEGQAGTRPVVLAHVGAPLSPDPLDSAWPLLVRSECPALDGNILHAFRGRCRASRSAFTVGCAGHSTERGATTLSLPSRRTGASRQYPPRGLEFTMMDMGIKGFPGLLVVSFDFFHARARPGDKSSPAISDARPHDPRLYPGFPALCLPWRR
ncbi:hypothetical protein F5X68DRAFT_20965 [Plectosphaerella plurivora]|uniref:Uncharacterized protein n=1 Tax=Plectosphaerella plurivora TaxID=936078 RepID=A0A9P8V9A7_9PEZI|nr:hypothetical protein F5X68DRAFT_20965 [Plectosphaerella plurivora]